MSRLDDLRDLKDILGWSRSIKETAKALVPAALRPPKILNSGESRVSRASAIEVAEKLRDLRNHLKGEVLSPDGSIDYAALRRSALYDELAATSRELVHVRPDDLPSDAERIAFFVNIYNVLVIHGVLALGIERSVMEVPSFFGAFAYRVGDAVLTPDGVENGVLRRNAKHPATGRRLFDDGHPALAFSPGEVDARIHVALVCAAASCPPVAFYEAAELDAQLDLAAAGFVGSDVVIDSAGRRISLPLIFKYYAVDFGGRDGVLDFIEEHGTGEHESALARSGAREYAFHFPRYDWSLNHFV